MSKVSYKFTIPEEKYGSFKSSITTLDPKITCGIGVDFNDNEKTAHFHCNFMELYKFFDSHLGEEASNFDFFCCVPDQYQDYKRFEDEKEVSLDLAKSQRNTKFTELESQLKSNEAATRESTHEIITECHYEAKAKRELIEKISEAEGASFALMLERMPSSQNEALHTWLNDGKNESPLPPVIESDCSRIDKGNIKQAIEESKEQPVEEDISLIGSGTRKILETAKRKNIPVYFIEDEFSEFNKGTLRHQNLTLNILDLKNKHPEKEFVIFCGTDHDNSTKYEATFTKVMGLPLEKTLENKNDRPSSSMQPENSETLDNSNLKEDKTR